ncbi:DMT family transporter [Paenibacillus flagellatus]|uniref:QacE family quaternary ammonium compound efflux SMR transporter n=1 Tax=Paenibacillus flagellatus TaxID=2211139 RepID=A0A2V5KCQ0_9BACL|nr:SMR family transporter [Paenibacillus flagellatus]PYI55743.1 QacE family quaternary ammonium compound efflux SMR transporter [Paenibacillus flagellatus]
MNRHWITVWIAGCFEIAWVIGLKHAYDATTWLLTLAAIAVSMALLIRASGKLPVGTTYAVFTGIGTAGTVLMETIVFGEPLRVVKLLLILLLVCGVAGLKLVTVETKTKEAS